MSVWIRSKEKIRNIILTPIKWKIRICIHIHRKFLRSWHVTFGFDIHELEGYAYEGLIEAIDRFNPNYGYKFSTYAYNYVLGEIINYIKSERAIKVSDEYMSIYKKYLGIKKALTDKLGRETSFKEICKFMEIEESPLLQIIESVSFTKSMDENVFNYGNDFRNEIDNKILIDTEIESLDPFDKSLIYNRYFNGLSQSETASEMGVSQAKVSRCEKLILSKMKKNICA